MKTVSPALASHLAGAVLTMTTCWKLKRTDGLVMGFTALDQDLLFDLGDGDGTVTYRAASGFIRSNIQGMVGFAADSVDVTGVLESAAITVEDIRAGRYDFAEIKVFEVNYRDLTQGALKLRRGRVANLRAEGDTFVAQLFGLLDSYSQEIGELYSPACRADLGDARCGVRREPPAWSPLSAYTVRQLSDAATGSVVKPSLFNDRHFECVQAGTSASGEPSWNTTLGAQTSDGSVIWEVIRALTIEAIVIAVASNREFSIDYGGDAPEALFTGGLCKFLDQGSPSPKNAGLNTEIKQYSVSPITVTLFQPMPFDIAIGDAVTIAAGCDKTLAVCRDSFDNIDNFRGEPHVPGNDLFFRIPDAR